MFVQLYSGYYKAIENDMAEVYLMTVKFFTM